MTPKPAEANGVSEIYELLRYAAARKQPVAAIYDGQPSEVFDLKPTSCRARLPPLVLLVGNKRKAEIGLSWEHKNRGSASEVQPHYVPTSESRTTGAIPILSDPVQVAGSNP